MERNFFSILPFVIGALSATLDELELHGPSAEVEKCKAAMDPLGTVYYEVDSGFQKFVR